MFSKLKEMKDLRSQAKKIEQELSAIHIEESHSGIRVKMSAKLEITELHIDDKTPANTIQKVLNTAIMSAQKKAAEHMRATGGLNIPGLS